MNLSDIYIIVCSFFLINLSGISEEKKVKPDFIIPIWNGDIPDLKTNPKSETFDEKKLTYQRVSKPQLWVYLPKENFGKHSVLMICPGGGFAGLGMGRHVQNAAPFFLDKNIVVIGVKYRTAYGGNDYVKDSLNDLKRAIRLVRHNAKSWNIDPEKITVQGYSAGGTVCMNLLNSLDEGNPDASDPVERYSNRPQLLALMCPWPHRKESSQYPIQKNPPRLFIASAEDDRTAPTSFAKEIGEKAIKQGGKVDWFIIPKGGHGAFHYKVSKGPGGQWPNELIKVLP